MNFDSLSIGDIVYKCGVDVKDNMPVSILVVTWKYLGVVEKSFTSIDCDSPHKFYKFIQCLGSRFNDSENGDSAVVYIPSARQIQNQLLSLEELMEEMQFWHAKIEAGEEL